MKRYRCSVINCGKELDENDGVFINGKFYCKECGVLLNQLYINELVGGITDNIRVALHRK